MTEQSLNTVVRMAAVIVSVTLAAGCSLAAQPPQGRSVADVASDKRECKTYAKAQPQHQGDHYAMCLVSRGYVVGVDFNELNLNVNMVQKRQHDTAAVVRDVAECDERAEAAKSNLPGVTVTSEEEASITGSDVISRESFVPATGFRRNRIRVLVDCLAEHGYAVVPFPDTGRGR